MWETSITNLLQRNSSDLSLKKSSLGEVLNMSVYVMTLAYTACESCGVDFYFHSSQSVINSNSTILIDR